jgi:signal transduction histidine kinase
MSFVLLLCLGAVAFLLNQYQKQVMEEVAQTISTVGQETLRTLDTRGLHDVSAVTDAPLDRYLLQTEFQFRAEHDPEETERIVRRFHTGPGGHTGEFGGVVMFSRFGAGGVECLRDGDPQVPCEELAEGEFWTSHDPEAGPVERKIVVDAGEGGWRERLFIRVEDIHTEGDVQGMVLRIPAWIHQENSWVATVEAGGAAVDSDGTAEPAGSSAADTVNASFPLHQEAIMLPINTQDYQELFTAFRRRSILLLLGVFLLGTILSASLASRFTRPVRRLDTGIRRLSEGDLDVEVEARGRDEIARLGRAFNEMTARLRAGKERERQLNRREKLSALGRLAAGVAHDVRNPLHSINLTLQHLAETCRPREGERGVEFDRSLGIIREEIRRLSRLVENFLRFARSDRQERAPVRMPDLLQETAQLVEKEAVRRGVRIVVDVGDDIPEVMADGEAVRSSVLNLVLNSFESMPDGGELTLSARLEGDDVLVEVSDSGAGISPEEQERVFDFAYTTRENGHGLGLPMVHQVVVEDHGGRVNLESQPGAGTVVQLAFPLPAEGVA